MLSSFFYNPLFVEFGYQEKTTFWLDFSIAEVYGEAGIKDTYNRAKEDWKDNIEYMTELAMVLNHKSWFWNAKESDKESMQQKIQSYVKLYTDLWNEIDGFIMEHFKNDEEAISYYLRVTD